MPRYIATLFPVQGRIDDDFVSGPHSDDTLADVRNDPRSVRAKRDRQGAVSGRAPDPRVAPVE